MQALLTAALLVLSLLVHLQFGWRTFSRVASAKLPLRAHTWLLRLRTLVEWSAVFCLIQLLTAPSPAP